MVSFQKHLPQIQMNTTPDLETSTTSNKRKRDEIVAEEFRGNPEPFSDLQLCLQTPLTSQWQRFLDIQSEQMNFYNTRAHERTLSDSRASEPADPLIPGGHMSLDLELNLPCGSYSSMETGNNLKQQNSNCSPLNSRSRSMKTKNSGDTERSQLLSLSLEADQQEMVTTVCPRCHMLIMIYKSSPVCPNCKFVHPPDSALQIYLAQGLASFASCSN